MAAASIGSAVIGSKGAKSAAKTQAASDAAAIAEQRAAREQMRQLLQPYVDAGGSALPGLLDLAGVGGGQQQAIDAIAGSPLFKSLAGQGEEAILANASATGGLRGGNVQGALAQFRPQLLNQFVNDQFGRLSGIVQMGQNSAAGVGSAGMNSASAIGSLLADQGAARAGGALGSANAISGGLQGIGQMFMLQSLLGGFGGGGGGGAPAPGMGTILNTSSAF
jgi:hypothetical protein